MFGEKSIRSSIVQALLKQPDQTADEIKTICKASKSAVYKELSLLIEEGVIFKNGPEYRMHLSSVMEFINLAQDVKVKYLESSDFLPELPQEGGKCRWKLTNLYRMNDLFTNVILALVKKAGVNHVLSWNPHPWFHLAQTQQENQFFHALKTLKVRNYKMVGGDTPLDHFSEQFWPPETVTYSFAPGPFHHLRQQYFTVVDPYIVTLELTPKLARQIEDIYAESAQLLKKNPSPEQLLQVINPRRFTQLFDQRSPMTLTLVRDKRKCEKKRKLYEEFFGRKF